MIWGISWAGMIRAIFRILGTEKKHYVACSPEEFCEYFFRVCLGILHWKMAGIFGGFFLVSVSHETKHEKSSKNSGKIRSKIRGKIRDENSKNSGNFRSAAFLWPKKHDSHRRDKILRLLRPEIGQFSPHVWSMSFLNCTVRKFVAPNKSFVPKFALQTCHPKKRAWED